MKAYRRKMLPPLSLTNNYKFDYKDIYECVVTNVNSITPDDVQVVFWTARPKWLSSLFRLRDLIVKPFGLKGGEEKNTNKIEQCIRSGSTYNFISIPEKSENETVLCLNDKHLKAHLSVYMEQPIENKQKVSIITLVQFHNWLGYAYFYTIYPFHHIVVKKMFEDTLKNLLSSMVRTNDEVV